jgi:hypothetical protein
VEIVVPTQLIKRYDHLSQGHPPLKCQHLSLLVTTLGVKKMDQSTYEETHLNELTLKHGHKNIIHSIFI